jgi:hypothetical protein
MCALLLAVLAASWITSSGWLDPPPWAANEQQPSQGSSSETGQQPQHRMDVVHTALIDITRDVAETWRDKLVAVIDTGHHSCLAAAIRLTAVYRLPQVVLLQAD